MADIVGFLFYKVFLRCRIATKLRELDGKHYPMKDFAAGSTAPPFHVNCRSTTVPYFADDFGVAGERAARDADGKTYYVPADLTYKEWEKAFVDGNAEGFEEVDKKTLFKGGKTWYN